MNKDIFINLYIEDNNTILKICNEFLDKSTIVLSMPLQVLPKPLLVQGFREKAKELSSVLNCDIQDDLCF